MPRRVTGARFALRRRAAALRRGRPTTPILQGFWGLAGLPGAEIRLLFFAQVGDTVIGQLTVRVKGVQSSYRVSGQNQYPNVRLDFKANKEVKFTFTGRFIEDRKIKGELSGSISAKAILFPRTARL